MEAAKKKKDIWVSYPFFRAFPGISFLKGQNAYPYSGSF